MPGPPKPAPFDERSKLLSALPLDALYRRVAVRLLPILFVCYLVALIDRLNVAFAKLQFAADLHFDDAVFGLAAGSLYVGYVAFEVPSNLMLARIGLRRTFLRIMVLWGLFTMLMAAALTPVAFYVIRFLIGAAEAGFFPGVVFYLTLWFPSRHRALMLSLILAAVPISGIVAGPLSASIMTRMSGAGGLYGWQWLFLLEGAPAILLGLLAYWALPDGPAHAGFLSSEEQQRILSDLAREQVPASTSATFAEALRHRNTYTLAAVYFAFYATQSILLVWVPTLLDQSGLHGLEAIGWRAAMIFAAGAIGMTAVSASSDASSERRWHLIVCGLVGGTAFLSLSLARQSPGATSLCLAIAAAAMFGFLTLFWTFAVANLGRGARAGGIALVSAIGSSGSALSPVFIGRMKVWTGSLHGAIGVLSLLFVASLTALVVLGRVRDRPEPPGASKQIA